MRQTVPMKYLGCLSGPVSSMAACAGDLLGNMMSNRSSACQLFMPCHIHACRPDEHAAEIGLSSKYLTKAAWLAGQGPACAPGCQASHPSASYRVPQQQAPSAGSSQPHAAAQQAPAWGGRACASPKTPQSPSPALCSCTPAAPPSGPSAACPGTAYRTASQAAGAALWRTAAACMWTSCQRTCRTGPDLGQDRGSCKPASI